MGIFEQLAEIKYQEGLEQGFEEGRDLIIRRLLARGMFSALEIARIMEVSTLRVRKIKKEISAK